MMKSNSLKNRLTSTSITDRSFSIALIPMKNSVRLTIFSALAAASLFLGGCAVDGGPGYATGAGYAGYGPYVGDYYGGYGPYYGDTILIGGGYHHGYYCGRHFYGGGYGHGGRFGGVGGGFHGGGFHGGGFGGGFGGGHGGGGGHR